LKNFRMRELVRSKTGGAIIGPDRNGLQDRSALQLMKV